MNLDKARNQAQLTIEMFLIFVAGKKPADIFDNAKHCAIKYQAGIIAKLKAYSIISEYENEVLNQIRRATLE